MKKGDKTKENRRAERDRDLGGNRSVDEQRDLIRFLLRNADKFIKEARLAEAKDEIEKIRDIDPKNVYAFAFQERIASLEQPADGEGAKKSQHPRPRHAAGDSESSDVPPGVIEALRAQIEQEYKEKFAQEVQQAEARLSKTLEEEEERGAQERIHMLEQLQKERTAYQTHLEESLRAKLQAELESAEEGFRERLAAQRSQAEEEARLRLEARHAEELEKLRTAMADERAALTEQGRRAVEEAMAGLEAEHSGRMKAELESLRESASASRKQAMEELEQKLRAQMERDFEARLQRELAAIGEKAAALRRELEKGHAGRIAGLEAKHREALHKSVEEARSADKKAFEAEMEKLRESQRKRLEEELDTQRAAMEEQARQALEAAKEESDRRHQRFMAEEQARLEEVRASLRREMEAEVAGKTKALRSEIEETYEYRMGLLGIAVPKGSGERRALYRDRLSQIWSGGPLTMEKANVLMELQELLGIGFEDHIEFEMDVRLDLYAHAVEQAILSGSIKPTDARALETLKERYEITPDEAARLEPHILAAFQRVATKGTLLVVDDDGDLVRIIQGHLQDLGYNVIGMTSVASAMEKASNVPVDFILSDIRFEGEKLDGFTFFKQSQQDPALKKIPFVLMSSLDEGLFIRTGIQLGVDDYLTKPLDLDLLTAVVEGKLKKYRSLR